MEKNKTCTSTVINGKEYQLNTTLRLAYKVQGMNGHKPYADVFSSIGDMGIEEQIAILYEAFALSNPDDAKFLTKQAFLDYYLDNMKLDDVMSQLKGVIGGVLGKDLNADDDEETTDGQGN